MIIATGDTWPRTAAPAIRAQLRTCPEDFEVEEQLPFDLSGQGEHVWLKVRKREVNTDRVAQALARAAGVPRRAVGYAGMKDRHAVAVQWFSVHLPGREAPAWDGFGGGIEVLESVRHTRKLQTGALSGNRFGIILRECAGDCDELLRRVEEVRRRGVPNYFGEQRFGRDSANVQRARAMFAGEPIRESANAPSMARGPRPGPIGDRHLRGIYLSAARAFLFNEVLARRVADGTWNTALDGEAFILDGSRSYFLDDGTDATLPQRLAQGDIHPSGPLWGTGDPPTRGAARALEDETIARHGELAAGLAQADLRQERRALRVFPRDLAADWLDTATLQLRFALPPGSYATAILRELADYRDVAAKV